jgi:uncharacterized protein (TIGR04255 family)
LAPRLSKEDLPDRLNDDSIIEAICEIRFDGEELEEVVAGRIAEWATSQFSNAKASRSGAAEIPASFREAQPHLKFQPLLEVDVDAGDGSFRKIRSGAHVFGYIVTGKYIGWRALKQELETAIDAFFERAKPRAILRVGLRYTNALTKTRHHVAGLQSLKVKLRVCDDEIVDEQVNLTYRRRETENHEVLVRLATPGLWSAKTPDTTVVVDLDVSTPGPIKNDPRTVKAWAEKAHELEKIEFFSLFPTELRKRLSA